MCSHVTFFLPALEGGGAERMILAIAGGVVEAGCNVDIVVTRARGALRSAVPPGARLVDLGARRIALSLPALVRYVREARPDVLMSTLTPTNLVAVAACGFSRHGLRLVLREATVFSQAKKGIEWWRRAIMDFLCRRLYPRADAIVAISEGVAQDLRMRLQDRCPPIHVVHNPVITSDVAGQRLEPHQEEFFLGESVPVIIGVGRLVAAKGFDTLIRAFELVRRERPVRLLILGEGPERQALENLADLLGVREYVTMPGFVANPVAFMKRSSVFVLSSRWEGFGNVLVEAMWCGLPVVSTDCPGGPREILENGRHGRLVSVDHVEEMAAGILEALAHGGAQSARSRAKDFTLDRKIVEYMSVLRHTDGAVKQKLQ